MNFQQLREKFRKGMGIKHFENPSIREIFNLLKNSKFGAVRLISHNDTLYVWDAYFAVHDTFYKNELFDYGFHNGENTGYIDINATEYEKEDADVELGQKLFTNHPYIMEVLISIEKEYEFTLKETGSDRDNVYYDFERNKSLTESAWSSPVVFGKYPTYVSIGHPGYEEFDPSDVLLWMHDGKRLIAVHPDDGEDIHHDVFASKIDTATAFGRIVHSEKVISFIQQDGTDFDGFSVAYDLKQKYPDYKILTQSGNRWKVFKG